MKRIVGALLISCMSSGIWADVRPQVAYLKSVARCILCKKPLGLVDYLGNRPDAKICLSCLEKERPPQPGSGQSSPRPESFSPVGSLSIESVYSGDIAHSSHSEDFQNPLLKALVDQAHYNDGAYQEFGDEAGRREEVEDLKQRVGALEKAKEKKLRKRRKAGINDAWRQLSLRRSNSSSDMGKAHAPRKSDSPEGEQVRAGRRNALVPGSETYRQVRLFGESSPTTTPSPLFSPFGGSPFSASSDAHGLSFFVSLRDGVHILGIKKGSEIQEAVIQELWGAGPLSMAVTSDGYYLRNMETNENFHFTREEEKELDDFLKKNGHTFDFKTEVYPYGLKPSSVSIPTGKDVSTQTDIFPELEEEKVTWQYQLSSTPDGRYKLEAHNDRIGDIEHVLDAPVSEVWYNSHAQLVAVTTQGYHFYDFNTGEKQYFLPYQREDLNVFLRSKNIVLTENIRNVTRQEQRRMPALTYVLNDDDTILQVTDDQGNTLECNVGSKIMEVRTQGTKVLVQVLGGTFYLYDLGRINSDRVVERQEFPADTIGALHIENLLESFEPCKPYRGSIGESLANYFPPASVQQLRRGEMIVRTCEHPLRDVLDTLEAGKQQFVESVNASDDDYTFLYDEVGKVLYMVGPGGDLIRKEVETTIPLYRRGAQLLLPQRLGNLCFFDAKEKFTELFFVGLKEREKINLGDPDVPGIPPQGFKAAVLKEGFKRILPEEGKTSIAIERAAHELSAARTTAKIAALSEQLARTNIAEDATRASVSALLAGKESGKA